MSTIRLFLLFILICFTTNSPQLYADEPVTSSDDPESTTPVKEDVNETKNTQSSEVERLLQQEKTLKNNKKKLRDFKNDLTSRSNISKKLQDELKQSSHRLEKQNTALTKAKEKGDTKQIARLETELKKLESSYELLKEQAQLTFAAEKTVRSQIELLEKSIIQQQQTLDEIKGVKKPTPVQPKQPAISTPPSPTETSQTIPTHPLQKIIPDTKQPPVATQTPTSPAVDHIQTAEQIEAQKQAEKRTDEAFRAEQVAIDYIEQKSVFIEQIKLDETLLQTDVKSLENYNSILLVMEKKLDDKSTKKLSQKERDKIKQNIKLVKSEIRKLNKQIEKRTTSLTKSKKRLEQREDDQEVLATEALIKREEAEAAQEHVVWLQSPLHPRNLLAWAYTRGPRVLLVFIIMVVLLLINNITASKISRVMARKSIRKGEVSINRANTLALSFRGAARVVIIFSGMLFALQEAGVDIKTVLGGAAILGIAVAFGAQNLMRDYFNGFMILLEDQYELNDVVTINDITGTVERVSMRTTMIRDLNGRAHFIPNGVITRVTNTTYEWSRAVFDIPVAYKENVDHVMSVILELANELQQDEEFGSAILSDPVMLGVNSFDENGLTIKFMLQTRSDKMWPVRREMLRRIKNKFDELGIEIPVPQRVIAQPVVTTNK
jgi:small conductance mechanosensitive channel